MTSDLDAAAVSAEMLDLVARLDDNDPERSDDRPTAALQAIVHLEADVPIGYEALARFDDGASADAHFERAAAAGRSTELELACCEAALGRLPELPPGTFISTNVSVGALTQPELIAMLRRVDTARVAVEVTQQSPLADGDLLEHHLAPIRSTGVRIAIDDVGVGDFSIERIAKAAPSVVKASPRLVTGCHLDDGLVARLTSVAELGRRLGALTIGVGVEHREEATVLRRLGFDAAQGHLFGAPSIDIS